LYSHKYLLHHVEISQARAYINPDAFRLLTILKMKTLFINLLLYSVISAADDPDISAVHYSVVEAGIDSTIFFINQTDEMTCDGCSLYPADDDTVKVSVSKNTVYPGPVSDSQKIQRIRIRRIR